MLNFDENKPTKVPKSVQKEMETASFMGCSRCRKGYIRTTDENGYEFYEECGCLKKFRLTRLKEKSNIPERYLNAEIDLVTDVKAQIWQPKQDAVGDFQLLPIHINIFGNNYVSVEGSYLKSEPRENCMSLILSGFEGSGKTKFAVATASKFLEMGYNIYYITVKQYMDMIKNSYYNEELKKKTSFLSGTGSNNPKDICHVLVLDELGKEYHTESGHAITEIKDLLKTRADKYLPTIIITNMMIKKIKDEDKDLEDIYGRDLFSMFFESYIMISMMCNKDYRVNLSKKLLNDLDMTSFVISDAEKKPSSTVRKRSK